MIRAWRVSCAVVVLSLPYGALRAASVPTDVDPPDLSQSAEEAIVLPAEEPLDLSVPPEASESPEAAEGEQTSTAPEAADESARETPDAASMPPEAEPQPTPDADTLRRLVATDPSALSSLSIGRPDAGALLNAVPLPASPLWHIRDPRRAWASEETVAFLAAAVAKVEERFPGSPALVIGDISLPHGGSMGRHRSHESGRDADIGWYFLDGPARDLRQGDARKLDLARCWALIRAFVTETDVQHIFMDRKLQVVLYRYALECGENQQWLLGLFGSVSGRRDALVEHERGHKNHIHVRFYNRRAQEWARLTYPSLVAAGLAPPPVVMHKAHGGETLSVIARRYHVSVAAIRAANGLRSSAIRAGRRYRIPVCRSEPPDIAPLVVPPRRLPPVATAGLLGASE